MNKLAVMIAALSLAMVVGCNSDKKLTSNSTVTDLRASNVAPPPAPMVQPAPINVQPVVSDTPVTVAPVATTSAASSSASSGSNYTVQKGDTLFKIARAKYGDASAVRKIKEANPGMDPDRIKVGQKIVLP